MLQAHIQLDESMTAKYAILPGDPARIDRIASFLDNVRELKFNREYRSIIGEYKGVEIVATSTGMGGSSTSIAVEELHNLGVEAMIRIGSCGAMQTGIGLGDLILASGAVRDDGASRAYVDIRYPAVPDTELLNLCIDVAKENDWNHHIGIVQSHESFYMDTNEEEKKYWSKCGVLGSDFETAAVFCVGKLRGIKTASILNNVVVYGENSAESVSGFANGKSLTEQGEEREILVALEALSRLER